MFLLEINLKLFKKFKIDNFAPHKTTQFPSLFSRLRNSDKEAIYLAGLGFTLTPHMLEENLCGKQTCLRLGLNNKFPLETKDQTI